MEDFSTITVNATRGQIEGFKKSILWKDIIRELDAWVEGFNREQDAIVSEAATSNPSTANILMHMGDIHGRKMAVQYFHNILDMFLGILEDKENDSRHIEAD